jgi:hypothetical protein
MNSDIQHLTNAPEILQDICHALEIPHLLYEWNHQQTLYCIEINTRVNDIIFDECKTFNTKQKVYCIYKYIINYLLDSLYKENTQYIKNPIIRIKDEQNIYSTNSLHCYKL